MVHPAVRDCPFCVLKPTEIFAEHELALARWDNFPVSKGHALISPRRHVASFFDTTREERLSLMEVLDQAKAVIDREYRPDGYNIGINGGPAAGQTVMHLHIHVIPRYKGDKADPRGGVRWIFPERARYW